MLDAAGGPGKVKPKKMREILQDSAFRHDLDPYFSWGFAVSAGNLLTINASADPNAISQFDPNVFTLTQFGLRGLETFSLNGSDGNPTQTPKGIVFDERPTVGQAFQIGRTIRHTREMSLASSRCRLIRRVWQGSGSSWI